MSKTQPKTTGAPKRRRDVAAHGSELESPPKRGRAPSEFRERSFQERAWIFTQGRITHALIPIEEYEELIKADMVRKAITQIEAGDNDFIEAEDLGLKLAAESIAATRKSKGLTQKQVGRKAGVPQSQISRIERNPDRTTVRTLKRIAKALGVDVSAFISGI